MKKLHHLLGSGSLCLLLLGTAHGQGVGSSGDIKGTVTDTSDAAAPKVTVVAVETEKGFRRTVLTDDAGQYRLMGLSPGIYDVSAELSGFETAVRKGVTLTVEETVNADFQLKVSPVKTQVEVTGEAPVVDTEKGNQADTIEQTYIRGLPIDRRDYLAYSLLVPGVTDSTRVAASQNFRVPQVPQSGLSFYGSNGRGNSVTVDGGENNDDYGAVFLNLSQDAVQEFQINRSNYAAELGGASGGSINIVSKSGTNDVHGSAYAFFRNDALDARDPFAIDSALKPGQPFSLTAKGTPVKPPLNRQQFGGTIGSPIDKDKTFLFLAYEGLRRNESVSVPLLTDSSIFAPTSGDAAILAGLAAQGSSGAVPCLSALLATQTGLPATESPATCAASLGSILTVNPNAPSSLKPQYNFAINQFETNGGVFPFKATEDLASGRLDHVFNANNQGFLRYNYGRDNEANANLLGLTGFSEGYLTKNWDSTIVGAWFHLFSPQTMNEARAQWILYGFNVFTNDSGGPELDVPGFAGLGRIYVLPSLVSGRHYELADNLTLMRGSHKMKSGADVIFRGNQFESHTLLSGRFNFGTLPGDLASPCLSTPTACGVSAPATSLTSLQSFALGLPQFYFQGFGSPTVARTLPLIGVYWQDSWAPWSSFTLNYGVRYELDKRYLPLTTDYDNVAPRVSFAWDPLKDHKTVVRGGYGWFYAPIYYNIDYVVRAVGVVDASGNAVANEGTGPNPVANLSQCAIGTITCNRQIAQAFITLSGTGAPAGINSALIYQTLFAQGKIGCGTPPVGTEACINATDMAQFGIPITHTGAIPPLSVLFIPASNYQNPYSQQAEFGIERQLGPSLSISVSYVWSHTLRIGRARDVNLLPAPFVPAGPANIPIRQWAGTNCPGGFLGLGATCFVNPLILQINQYESSASALYQAGILEVNKRFSNHFGLMASYTYSKALDDTTDWNSDYEAFDQASVQGERGLSEFDQRHKVVVAGVFESPWKGGADANFAERILSGFTLSPIVRGNSSRPFNLLVGGDVNGDRHSTNDRPPGAPRDSGIGPDFWTFDMRLTRQFGLGEKVRLQLMAEGFNILNRTNFATVNNVVGLIGPPFNLHASEKVSPSTGLGYNGALAKREIQLGLRFTF